MRGEPTTILHVEDNRDHADLVARTLAGHCRPDAIHLVDNGQSALDYLFRRGEYKDPLKSPRPQVVILDLRLPKVDGLDVLHIIKTTNELSSIPVVVLTSSDAESDLARAYEKRANSYLVKPLGYPEFAHMMNQFGLYWIFWNRYP